MISQFIQTLVDTGLDQGQATKAFHILAKRVEQSSVKGQELLVSLGIEWDKKKPAESLQALINALNNETPETRYLVSRTILGDHDPVLNAFWNLYDQHRIKAPLDIQSEPEPVVEKVKKKIVKVAKSVVSPTVKKAASKKGK